MTKLYRFSLAARDEVIELSFANGLLEAEKAYFRGHLDIAQSLATQLIAFGPTNIEAVEILCQCHLQKQQYQQVINACNTALSNNQTSAKLYYFLSCGYRQLRFPEKALKALQQAIEVKPENLHWQVTLGIMFKEKGQLDSALKIFNNAINKAPEICDSYWYKSDIDATLTVEQERRLIDIVTKDAIDTVERKNQVFAAYALYKYFEGRQNYDQAFEFLSQGASLQRTLFNYQNATEINEHKSLEAIFDHKLLNANNLDVEKTNAQTAHQAIFICGLPRSGTTLIEQILSCHSEITGGDELFELTQATQEIINQVKPDKPFPYWAKDLPDASWLAIGNKYIELTKPIASTKYLTDKMPLNYKAIGLISKALPNAKIIYCARDPMDLLIAGFQQILGSGNQYSYDLDELSDMIIAHRQLMSHWVNCLPHNLLKIDYEALINAQRETTEKLLAFIGVDWQENCLAFHKNNRTVHTVSNTQIRQPLFTHSVNRWCRYQKQLMPYYEKFQQAGLYPKGDN